MAQPLDLRRLLATGIKLTETGRSQAQQLWTGAVEQARQTTDQISLVADELFGRGSREHIEDLRQTVRAEVHQQLQTFASDMDDRLASQSQGVAERIASAVDEMRELVGTEVQRQHANLVRAHKEDLGALRDDLAALAARIGRPATSPPTDPGEASGTTNEEHARALDMTAQQERAVIETPMR